MKRFLPLSLLALLALCLGLAACGRKQESNDPAPLKESTTPNLNEERTQALMSQTKVTCRDMKQCPSSVGLLVTANQDSVGMCTAFLLADNLVLTSADCLPRSIRKAGSSCEKLARVSFPDNGAYQKDSAKCTKVMAVSQQERAKDVQALNYAILKLDHNVERERLEISSEGVEDNQILQNFKLDPIEGDAPQAELSFQECRAVQKSLALPQFNEPLFPVISFADCKISYGNSGSPLLDSKGRVRAMAHFGRVSSLNEIITTLLRQNSEPANIYFGSNFSCIPNPIATQQQNFPEKCGTVITASELEKARDKLLSDTEKNAKEIFQKQLNAEVEPGIKAFRWKAVSLAGSSTDIFQVPECYLNPSKDSWIKKYDLSFGLGLWYPKKRTREYTLPIWKLNMTTDAYQVPQIIGQKIGELKTTIEMSPRKIHRDEPTFVKEAIFLKPDQGTLIYETDIKKCE